MKNRTWWLWGWWGLLLVGLLGVWPAYSHAQWHRPEPALHGIPAMFLGALVVLAVWGAAEFVRGLARDGWRWLISRGLIRLAAGWLALLVSVLALFYAIERWRGQRAWARVVAEAGRRGESLDPDSLRPDPVAASEDFGQAPFFEPLWKGWNAGTNGTVIPAGQEFERFGPLKPLLHWGNSAWSTERGLPAWTRGAVEDWEPRKRGRAMGQPRTNEASQAVGGGRAEEVRRGVEALAPMLDAIREPAGRPHCRLPFDYDFAFLGDEVSARTLLWLERLAFLQSGTALTLGREDEALRELRLGLLLAGHTASQPSLYTRYLQASILGRGLQPLWEGLRRRCWSETQVAELQGLLDRHRDRLRSGERSSDPRRMVAVSMAAFVEGLVPGRGEKRAGWAGMTEEDRRVLGWVRRVYPVGWSLQDQAAVLEAWLRASDPAAGAAISADDVRQSVCRGTSDPVFPVFVMPKFVAMWVDGESQVHLEETLARLAATACGIERFRMATGGYPEGLTALVPRYVSEVPTDPMAAGGAALRYRREGADGYVLHSVGPDGRDDGGVVRSGRSGADDDRRWEGEADWVWRGGGGTPR